MPGDRGREGALLFGYFLLGKQEKVTARQGWRAKPHTDVSRLSRSANNQKKSKWIPAFAGMTKKKITPLHPADSPAAPPRTRRASRHAATIAAIAGNALISTPNRRAL